MNLYMQLSRIFESVSCLQASIWAFERDFMHWVFAAPSMLSQSAEASGEAGGGAGGATDWVAEDVDPCDRRLRSFQTIQMTSFLVMPAIGSTVTNPFTYSHLGLVARPE